MSRTSKNSEGRVGSFGQDEWEAAGASLASETVVGAGTEQRRARTPPAREEVDAMIDALLKKLECLDRSKGTSGLDD